MGHITLTTKIGYEYGVVWSDRACRKLIGKPFNFRGRDVIIIGAKIVKEDPTLIEVVFNVET